MAALITSIRLSRNGRRRITVPPGVIKTYLYDNIHYFLDDVCLDGLNLFYRYAVDCGALPAVPTLRFL